MIDILHAGPQSGMMSRKFVCVNLVSGLIRRLASVDIVHITVSSAKILAQIQAECIAWHAKMDTNSCLILTYVSIIALVDSTL